MASVGFLLKRLRRMDYARMRATLALLEKESGKGRAWLLRDLIGCALRYGAGYMDYRIARMYALTPGQRATVITRGINNRLVRAFNDKAFWHFFDDKAEFNRGFARWIGRDWLRADASLNPETLRRFLNGKESVFAKPLTGSSGQGIRRFTGADWQDAEAFCRTLGAMGDTILEETIVQHPKMAALYPGSVNTLRVTTLIGPKAEGIVYAFVRIGNGGFVDNVDTGGMAARVDLETGRLSTPGADKQGRVFERHPLTDTLIPGFELPFFEEAREMCLQAMRVVPQLRYVAWDAAITPAGPVLIEGNSFPSHAVPQFAAHYPDGIGILSEFSKFVDL